VFAVSGATHQGVEAVLYKVVEQLDAAKAERLERARAKTQAAWAP
jgi:GTP-binding protein